MWKWYALLSAIFAALTAIFSKLGVRNVNPDLATALRVSVILVMTWGIALCGGGLRHLKEVDGRSLLFLILPHLFHTLQSFSCGIQHIFQGIQKT